MGRYNIVWLLRCGPEFCSEKVSTFLVDKQLIESTSIRPNQNQYGTAPPSLR
jgi:hypothetical protein